MRPDVLVLLGRGLLVVLLSMWCGNALVSAVDGPATVMPKEKDPSRHVEFLTIAKAGGVC